MADANKETVEVVSSGKVKYKCKDCDKIETMDIGWFNSNGGTFKGWNICHDCALKNQAAAEAEEFGGYGDLARGLKHLIDNSVLSVSAGGGYASISCRTPKHEDSVTVKCCDCSDDMKLEGDNPDPKLSYICDGCIVDRSTIDCDEMSPPPPHERFKPSGSLRYDDVSEYNALVSVLGAIRSRQSRGNAGNSDDAQNQTPKQALDAAIFAAVEQFEEATGCQVESAEYSCGNPYEHRNVLVRSK